VDGIGATYNVAWSPSAGATFYTYTAGAGVSSQQGTTVPPSLVLKMPYMANGQAGSGYVCIKAANAAGSSADASCNTVAIPPATAPPPPTGTLTVGQAVSRCRFWLTSTPPDTTGGWTVKYFQGATAVTSPVELVAGNYTFTAQWTKPGQTMRKPPAVNAVCP